VTRTRPILPVKELREIATDAANDMNKVIRRANEDRKEIAIGRLGDFVHEALGRLDVMDLIEEWEQLEQRKKELEAQFARYMGEGQHIMAYVPSARRRLLERLVSPSERPSLPEALITQLHAVAKKYGVPMDEVVPIGSVQVEELTNQLKLARSTEELKLIVNQYQLRTLIRVGVLTSEGRSAVHGAV
jgi:hypothetical protein